MYFFSYVYAHAHLECVCILAVAIDLDVNNMSHTFTQASTTRPMHVKVDIHIDGMLSKKRVLIYVVSCLQHHRYFL